MTFKLGKYQTTTGVYIWVTRDKDLESAYAWNGSLPSAQYIGYVTNGPAVQFDDRGRALECKWIGDLSTWICPMPEIPRIYSRDDDEEYT